METSEPVTLREVQFTDDDGNVVGSGYGGQLPDGTWMYLGAPTSDR
jgi:hypothetical protein